MGEVGVWRGKSGQEAFAPPGPDQRPLVSPGTFVVGDQMRISWPSRGSVEWPSTRSPTSVLFWPRQWPENMFFLRSLYCSSGGGKGRGGISLQTCDTPVSGTIAEGTTRASSGGTGAFLGHGRLSGR